MGTRADFYIGKGAEAQWLGSTHWDGYPDGFVDALIHEEFTAETWPEAVLAVFAERRDVAMPEGGWPWPWDSSDTTDYAYTWTPEGGVQLSNFGRTWVTPEQYFENDHETSKHPSPEHPDMSDLERRPGFGPGASTIGNIVLM